MSDEDADMQDMPTREAPLVFGTLADAVQRSGAGVAAAVESGNVQLAATAEHLELSLVRCGARAAACAPRAWHLHSRNPTQHR
jgi:hypothetical protein